MKIHYLLHTIFWILCFFMSLWAALKISNIIWELFTVFAASGTGLNFIRFKKS